MNGGHPAAALDDLMERASPLPIRPRHNRIIRDENQKNKIIVAARSAISAYNGVATSHDRSNRIIAAYVGFWHSTPARPRRLLTLGGRSFFEKSVFTSDLAA
jgi:hypothetical protein